MFLGTALSTLGATTPAAAATPEISASAIANVGRYCTACWRNARLPMDRWGDCTQEVFHRLLGSVPPAGWDGLLAKESSDRRELIRAIDAVKKRTQREYKRYTPLAGVVADHPKMQRLDERAAVDEASGVILSSRQQRIMQMSFEGATVADIAAELQLAPERVSDEKYKAIRKLREHFNV
jgi:DNA-directed RNA polymerase specialized sigma24 family protein